MSAASLLRYGWLAWFSKPKNQRALYRAVRKHRPRRIVELGLQTGERSVNLVSVAQRYANEAVQYTGIDLFEARDQQSPGLSLKRAHQLLKATGATVRLVPGDPLAALSRSANSLTNTDLLLISADQDEASLDRAWFYLPRMLHPATLIFREEPCDTPDGESTWRRESAAKILDHAEQAANRRRAA